jgi:hypothetical protein
MALPWPPRNSAQALDTRRACASFSRRALCGGTRARSRLALRRRPCRAGPQALVHGTRALGLCFSPAGPFGTPTHGSIALLRWAARRGHAAFGSRARCGGPRALARTCAPNRRPTRAGTQPSERRSRSGCSSSIAPGSAASPGAPHALARRPAGGPRVLFPIADRRRTLVSNDSLESTGRPAALPRPWRCPGRPATQLKR